MDLTLRKLVALIMPPKNLRKYMEELRKDKKRKLSQKQVRKIVCSVRTILRKDLPHNEMKRAVMTTLNHVGGDYHSYSEDLGCIYPKENSDLPWDAETIKSIQVLNFLSEFLGMSLKYSHDYCKWFK